MDYTIAVVDKALELLLLVARQPGLGVTELARQAGTTKARAFRLLTTLEQREMVKREHGGTTYILGSRTLYIGAAARQQVDLIRVADEQLRALGGRCNENLTVRVREGLETVCVARWESSHAVRVNTQIGSRRPLHASASGKLLLAHAPEAVQREILESGLTRFTANTIVDAARLRKELAGVRENGFATSFGEIAPDAVAIAAPVRDASGSVVASLSIAGPSSRVTRKSIGALIELVVQGAEEYSRAIGQPPGAIGPAEEASPSPARRTRRFDERR